MAGEPRRTRSSQIMDSHIGEPGGGANALPRIEHFRRGEVALVRDVRPIALEGKHIIVIPRQGLIRFRSAVGTGSVCATLRRRYSHRSLRDRRFPFLTKGEGGSYRDLLVVVELAILLNRICEVSTCQWLTNCLVFSSF